MKTRDIINILEKKFPKINAEEWDNVGLLVGDYDKEVKKIQFSIDASLEVIENAIKEKVDMIITHHPFIFKAISFSEKLYGDFTKIIILSVPTSEQDKAFI